ncbi:phosphotriesterase-related protein isoform X2 [Epargyreus clarus]
MDFQHFYRKPPSKIKDKFEQHQLDNIGFIRQYPYSSRYNLVLNDDAAEKAIKKDLYLYKKCGGGTIVENSTHGLNRNIEFYKEVSEYSGVHVVAGTGFYIADLQADDTLHSTQEEMYELMLKEITEGCVDYPDVKAGFLGEIASVWPIKDFERRALRAAGEVQEQAGCGVSLHPHRDRAAPAAAARIYLEAGGRADKLVMSHLDRTLQDVEGLLEFAELGTYCQFDLFGTEVSYYQLCPDVDMPSDAQRLEMVRQLVNEGKTDRVLMSHDIHTKHRLIAYGGHGYSHIINNILPRMKSKGFSQKIIDRITIENPAEWLSMNKGVVKGVQKE